MRGILYTCIHFLNTPVTVKRTAWHIRHSSWINIFFWCSFFFAFYFLSAYRFFQQNEKSQTFLQSFLMSSASTFLMSRIKKSLKAGGWKSTRGSGCKRSWRNGCLAAVDAWVSAECGFQAHPVFLQQMYLCWAGRLIFGTYSFFYSTVNPSTYLQQGEYSLLYSRLGQLPPPVQIFCLHTLKGERVSATAVCLAEACLVVV